MAFTIEVFPQIEQINKNSNQEGEILLESKSVKILVAEDDHMHRENIKFILVD